MYILSISFVYPEEKEVRKDYEQERKIGRLVRVSDSVRHAQAYGLARRVQQRSKAAFPPPRLKRK